MQGLFAGALALSLVIPAISQAAEITAQLEKMTQGGGKMRAEFSVNNPSSAMVQTVVVKCTMFDKGGASLGTATGSVSDLRAGKRDTGTATTQLALGLDQVVCRATEIY